MNIDSIQNGIVIDHIPAGRGMRLYDLLDLGGLDCAVALIKNAHSNKSGKKDIIKIDADVPIDLNLVGYLAPEAKINIIRDGVLVEKKAVKLPETLTNVIRCENPRCISAVEQELDQVFKLTDRATATYRCIYCETKAH
jgi:aspartate carbamoyltransferase regulatory subunit